MVDKEQVKIGMPLEEFLQLYATEGPFELINGERKRKMPGVGRHSTTIRTVFRAIDSHAVAHDLGEAFP
jgi:hypothetical protein